MYKAFINETIISVSCSWQQYFFAGLAAF